MVLSSSGHEEFERIELHDLPEEVLEEIRRRAARHGHSLSREIEALLRAGVAADDA